MKLNNLGSFVEAEETLLKILKSNKDVSNCFPKITKAEGYSFEYSYENGKVNFDLLECPVTIHNDSFLINIPNFITRVLSNCKFNKMYDLDREKSVNVLSIIFGENVRKLNFICSIFAYRVRRLNLDMFRANRSVDLSYLCSGMNGLKEVNFPDNLEIYSMKETFKSCRNLKEICFNGVRFSPNCNFRSTFVGCDELEVVDFALSLSNLTTDNRVGELHNTQFVGCKKLKAILGFNFNSVEDTLMIEINSNKKDTNGMFTLCNSLVFLETNSQKVVDELNFLRKDEAEGVITVYRVSSLYNDEKSEYLGTRLYTTEGIYDTTKIYSANFTEKVKHFNDGKYITEKEFVNRIKIKESNKGVTDGVYKPISKYLKKSKNIVSL